MKKFRSLSPETHGRGQQKVELNWRFPPPNPMVSFFAVFLVTYLFNIFFRSLDSNIKKNMVEIEEFLIFFLLGYWTFDPIFTLVRYVKHWIEHHIYRRGNLDKFYVSEFIVGVIKIAIPTSKMESDVSTPNYTYTSRQTPRNESSVFSYPCRYKHLWKHFFFFSKLRARKSLIQDICDSLRVTARNLSTYIKVSFEMKFFFLCSYKAITQRMLLDIDKTAIYLKKYQKFF